MEEVTRRSEGWPVWLGVLVVSAVLVVATGCDAPECAHGDYGASECRVAAENHYARLVTSTGLDVRFGLPDSEDASSWVAGGLVEELGPDQLRIRPAGLMGFTLSIDPRDREVDAVIELVLDNVADDVVLRFGPAGLEQALAPSSTPGVGRRVSVTLPSGQVSWLRGERPCPSDYTILAAGDVQTGQLQFERIVRALHEEVEAGEVAGRPVLGLLLLGDLAEHPVEAELRQVEDILRSSPIPVAVVPGNHDVHGDELAVYNRVFGPGNYAFSACRTRVAMLDTGSGDLAASIQARLPDLLDRTSHDFLIAGTHYPAYPGRTGNGMADADSAWLLLSELERHEADVLVAGHYHTWLDFPAVPVAAGSVHQLLSGTLGANQGVGYAHFGVTRLQFAGDELTTCFSEIPAPGLPEDSVGGGGSIIRFCD